jgi:hypothetical protein
MLNIKELNLHDRYLPGSESAGEDAADLLVDSKYASERIGFLKRKDLPCIVRMCNLLASRRNGISARKATSHFHVPLEPKYV